ncbi:MAG: hypothetical protein DMF28_00065 [Verrucomicrobia bacterium]|nr:MAG: hypothetical protein DMF28_00065 [Verrucomicrobiota bacterium]
MTQVGRGFKWPILSNVVVFCDLDRVFWASKSLQPIHRFVIAMRQDKALGRCFFNQNLTETEWSTQRTFEQRVDGVRHTLTPKALLKFGRRDALLPRRQDVCATHL